MTDYVIHGFGESGDQWHPTIELLKTFGHDADDYDYGWRWLILVWFASRIAARGLASILKEDDRIIAYSNGCNVAMQALALGAPCKHVILIAPALKSSGRRMFKHWHLPDTCLRIDILAAKKDWVVEFAKWALFFTPWGNAGRVGYTGSNRKIHSHFYERGGGWPPWAAHLSWPKDPKEMATLLDFYLTKRKPK